MTGILYYATHDTSIGKLLLVAGDRGICYLTLLADDAEASIHLSRKFGTPPKLTLLELDGFFASSAAAIDRYLAGKGAPLSLPFDLAGGTALQRAVWLEIFRIPYGETISYSLLAERVGFPRAVRVVASACGANPVPLVIPCHRVIARDGTPGGFSLGGLEVKERLLRIESAQATHASDAA